MSDLIDIGTIVADHLRSLGPVPVDAGTLARVVDGAFFTIPRDQVTDVEHEYVLPRELVEDAVAIDQIHDMHLVEAVAESLRSGLRAGHTLDTADADQRHAALLVARERMETAMMAWMSDGAPTGEHPGGLADWMPA